jgi:hypothetical protein
MKIGALLLGLLLLACAWPMAGALQTGYCDFRLNGPRAELMKANGNQSRPLSLASWQALEQAFKAQHQTCSTDPQIPADLANLYLLRAQGAAAVPEMKAFFSEIALDYLQQSLRYRPAIAQNWANLALIKADLGQFDGEFEAAYNNARALGPLHMGVIQTLTMALLPHPQEAARLAQVQADFRQLPTQFQRPTRVVAWQAGHMDW